MFISESNLAALIGTSTAVVKGWTAKGVYPSHINDKGIAGFNMEDLTSIPEVANMIDNNWEEELNVEPLRDYTSVELFAGGGGLALGMAKAGFKHVLLNEFEKAACNTLRVNHPEWNIIEGDVRHIDFTPLRDKVDFLSGGFPCQAFSFAGKQGGFNDVRGTLFFELARAVKEINPKVFLCENVKGLVSHDNGKTFATICNIIDELGYSLVTPRVLKALMYQVPQKRERIILVAIRKDLVDHIKFEWPSPYKRVLTLQDAFYKSPIFDCEVPDSEGVSYPAKKKAVLEKVPQGGDWRDLPEEIAKEYMGGSWLLGGGKTGMARRLSLDEPSLTLTCSPCQKQTERCHPLETRPLTVREYARIQTFPDNWVFMGTMNDKYKQIGNAVPVNMAWAVGRSLIRLFNQIQRLFPSTTVNCQGAVNSIIEKQSRLIVVKDKKNQTSTVTGEVEQLNLFSLFEEYAFEPIVNNYGKDPEATDQSTLVGFVKSDIVDSFMKKDSLSYFTGKKFPSTIDIKNLHYFIPYIKGKGIRDLYIIRCIRIADKLADDNKEGKHDYRLCFELEFVKQLFDDYKPHHLEIYRAFTETNLNILNRD